MDQCKQTNHHNPEEDSGKPCQGLEEPVADGRLVVGGEGVKVFAVVYVYVCSVSVILLTVVGTLVVPLE